MTGQGNTRSMMATATIGTQMVIPNKTSHVRDPFHTTSNPPPEIIRSRKKVKTEREIKALPTTITRITTITATTMLLLNNRIIIFGITILTVVILGISLHNNIQAINGVRMIIKCHKQFPESHKK